MNAETVFKHLIQWRWALLALSVALFLGLAAQAPMLIKDTSADAFIDPLAPALLNRDRVEEVFGLSDPIVVAVVNRGREGIYNPGSMKLVAWIGERLQHTANIDPDRVTSLATESFIRGNTEGMVVEDFFAQAPEAPGQVARMQKAVEEFPLFQGALVARNGQATLIIAELMDPDKATDTYNTIMAELEQAPLSEGDVLHVTGEGAVAAYLSTYVDRDASRLNPLAALVITLVLFLAFRSLRSAVLPNMVVLMTVGGTIGTMAAMGISFYVITNGLVVCMIGIAVADSVHIFSQYYEEIRRAPSASGRAIVVKTMVAMWRPITLTTLTTIAGFVALALTTTMPPIYYFGVFGAWAVVLAWLFSMITLPCVLSMLPPRASRSFAVGGQSLADANRSAKLLDSLGAAVLARPRRAVLLAAIAAVLGGLGSLWVEANEERIASFQPDEAIYIADREINQLMDGTYYLDVVIETDAPEGIYEPEVLHRIEETQRYLESLPGVGGTTSIVDYIKRMYQAVNEDDPAYYRIPDSKTLIAQLFLLYSASGDPADFEEEIDGERKLALIRANVSANRYRDNAVLVEAARGWLADHYPHAGATATLTGDLNVDYHWMSGIVRSNLLSIVFCLTAVLLMAALLFRSFTAGIFAVLPVAVAVLFVYAVMGVCGIWLGVSTSMFASIAIGLGVDFSIHTLHAMRERLAGSGDDWAVRLGTLYASTGRAQLFNFLAIALGFAVLTTSTVPPLVKFGALVGVAVASAFLAAMTLLPALAVLLKPRFLTRSAS